MNKNYFNKIRARFFIEAAATAAAFVAAIVFFAMKDFRTCAILAAISVLVLTDLFVWMYRQGMRQAIMMGEAELEFDKAEQQNQIDKLSEPFTHNDDFLKGFAACLEYFMNNYLMDETISVTERQFFKIFTTMTKADGKTKEQQYDFGTYRNYMLILLFGQEKITTEEYETIMSYIQKPDIRKALARVIYSKELFDLDTEQKILKIREKNEQES